MNQPTSTPAPTPDPTRRGELMNIQPAQQVPANTAQSDQPLCLCHDTLDCPEQATVEINANQLARIADHLADYLRATGHDHPQPPHWASYDANLLIDPMPLTLQAGESDVGRPAM